MTTTSGGLKVYVLHCPTSGLTRVFTSRAVALDAKLTTEATGVPCDMIDSTLDQTAPAPDPEAVHVKYAPKPAVWTRSPVVLPGLRMVQAQVQVAK